MIFCVPRSKEPKEKTCRRGGGEQAVRNAISLSFELSIPYSSKLELLEGASCEAYGDTSRIMLVSAVPTRKVLLASINNCSSTACLSEGFLAAGSVVSAAGPGLPAAAAPVPAFILPGAAAELAGTEALACLLSSPPPSSLGLPAAPLLLSTYAAPQSQRVPRHSNCHLLNNLEMLYFQPRWRCPFLEESPLRLMECSELRGAVVLGGGWDAAGIQESGSSTEDVSR